LDVPLGEYHGGLQWTSVGASTQELILDPDYPTIYMQVGEDLRGAQADLKQNRELWESRGISNYRFEFEEKVQAIRIEGWVVATVAEDSLTGVALADGGDAVMNSRWPHFLGTMDDLFETLQEMIDARAPAIVAEFDPAYGFPRTVSVDREQGIDDEFKFIVSNFEVMPIAN
jgi:hypothetical protein